MTVPAFTPDERHRAKLYLATTVAGMIGRKFEEDDWAKVYAAAKGFDASSWSNFDVDVMNGNLGVEHKMIGRDGAGSLLECCGQSYMHPAGTRAIRFPDRIEDPTKAAREVLRQYGAKITERTAIVQIINDYHHAISSRSEAMRELMKSGMGQDKAGKLIPEERRPVGLRGGAPDMRFGWMIWRRDLAEFLYFEQPMSIPQPADFVGEWHERKTRGRRLSSRNLWIYRRSTGTKEYSITNVAGVKVQPYFTVPMPSDPNLYHFQIQGELAGNGLVRIWLTHETWQSLKLAIGDLSPGAVTDFIERNSINLEESDLSARTAFEPHAVELLVPTGTYRRLRDDVRSLSDEHAFRMLLHTQSRQKSSS